MWSEHTFLGRNNAMQAIETVVLSVFFFNVYSCNNQRQCQYHGSRLLGRRTVIQDITQIITPRGENPLVKLLTMDGWVERTHGTTNKGCIWND